MDILTIVVAIVAFLVVTLLLVALLLFAKAKLTSVAVIQSQHRTT